MTIAEYLRSISFEDIEEILWEVYGMGDNFTPFIKMTYDRICHQTGTSEHSYLIVQIVNSSIDPLGMNVIMPEGYKKDSLENLGKYKVIFRGCESPDTSSIAASIMETIIRNNQQGVLEPFHSLDIVKNTKFSKLVMNIYKLVIKVLLPKKCVPEKMSEQELYNIIRKRHCRNIALLKLYTFNKVYSLFVQYKQICKTHYLIRRLTKNNSQGLNSKNFKWLYHKSCQMEKEYVSFAFEKNKRVEYFTELIEMFNLPFTGWGGFLILTRTSSKHPLLEKEKNNIKKIITDLDGKNYRWYQSYDENLGEDLYLLIVKWFNKKRAWSSYDFSFLISKFIKL